jgi:pimeloyl-ACP methyl ester carboxylesterase
VSVNLSGSGVDDRGEFTLVERFGHNTYSAELDDLLQIVTALAAGQLGAAPPTSIGLVGHSRGGGIAVLAAAEDRRIAALVTWASISSVERWSPAEQWAWREAGMKEIVNTRTGQRLPLYPDVLDDIERNALTRLDILGAAARLTIPWLILHGAIDESVSPLEAEALHAAGRGAGVRHVTIEGAGHTFGSVHPWQGETPHFRLVADETLGFLAAHLG